MTRMRPLRPSLRGLAPGLDVERELWERDGGVVVGIDEVGRGAWAGPLSVGAAIIPRDRRIYKVRDSKLLHEPEREALFERVAGWCAGWSVGHASPVECDELGMSAAQKLAAQRALEGLGVTPDHVLVDGSWDFVNRPGSRRIVGGDRTCLSIATASILAKVTRDRIMRGLAEQHPHYNFEANKGYPCWIHRAGLQAWGPSTIHRRSWVYMEGLMWTGVPRYFRDGLQLAMTL